MRVTVIADSSIPFSFTIAMMNHRMGNLMHLLLIGNYILLPQGRDDTYGDDLAVPVQKQIDELSKLGSGHDQKVSFTTGQSPPIQERN